MHTLPAVSIIFLTISVIFLFVSLRNFLQSKGEKAIATRIWLRMAFIFAWDRTLLPKSFLTIEEAV